MYGTPTAVRIEARFDWVRPTLRPRAKLAEAIAYVLNLWEAFVRYTSDGRIPMVNLGPAQCGQPVLETSFPTAFQQLEFRDGDLGVSLPGNQRKRQAFGRLLQKEPFLMPSTYPPHWGL